MQIECSVIQAKLLVVHIMLFASLGGRPLLIHNNSRVSCGQVTGAGGWDQLLWVKRLGSNGRDQKSRLGSAGVN